MKDIIFNGDVARIYSRGKMEKREGERCVPILRTYNLLKTWVESHPRKSDPESWVWSYGKEPLPENYFRRQLEFLAKKVGINKPNHPYILRHTALTRFYKNCSGQVAKKLAGHSGSSEMADVYCHLSENDMENSVRALNGMPKKSEQEEAKTCRKCGSVLDLGCDICGKCGLPQNSKGALEKLEFEETLMKLGRIVLKRSEQNPRIIDMLMAEKEH